MWPGYAVFLSSLVSLGAGIAVGRRFAARPAHSPLNGDRGRRLSAARAVDDSFLQGYQGLVLRIQAVRNLLPDRPADAMAALDTVLELTDAAIDEGHRSAAVRLPGHLAAEDLIWTLHALDNHLAQAAGSRGRPALQVSIQGQSLPLDSRVRVDVALIAYEALVNAYGHADAHVVIVDILFGEQEFRLHVRDDGRGFYRSTFVSGEAADGGLRHIDVLAEKMGGRVEVLSERESGSEVRFIMPADLAYRRWYAST